MDERNLRAKNAEYNRRYRRAHSARLAPINAARMRKRWRVQPRVVEGKRKLRQAARGTSGKRQLWAQGDCRRCGAPFLASANGVIPAYCSHRCCRSDIHDRRRARRRGAFVERVWRTRIFDRDGWRCQLCGKAVNLKASVPHPKAPVLDHVIPLAVGGSHEPANVQCAHFICNSIKSHGVYGTGDQLRLIG